MNPTIPERIARLYDISMPDWPGEIDFYRQRVAQHLTVLDVACGTGRIAVRLAAHAARITGIDISAEMLAEARRKCAGIPNLRLEQADMRSFDLGETFALAIIPAHSFQFMLTPADQVACLETVRRHLDPGGQMVVHLDHQDFTWLGELRGNKNNAFQPAEEIFDPQTGNGVRATRAWTYQPATQTASATNVWEEIGPDGAVIDRWRRGPVPLHCVFRFEMEHLLARTGYKIEGVYGDFSGGALQDESSEMIWVASR